MAGCTASRRGATSRLRPHAPPKHLKGVTMNIFVGNLTFTTTEEDLALLFHPYGELQRVQIITEPGTGRSRGFGFVEMPDATQAQAAIAGLHGTALGGRLLTVTE